MDGIGTFPLFGTLMSYANGARFVGATNEIRSITTRMLTHNIVDYKFAIFFIAHLTRGTFGFL